MPDISKALIAALLIACLALASLYKCTRDERDAALQSVAIATETNKVNKETIDTLKTEIIKRDELAAAWQEELAAERRARDAVRKELNAVLEQNEIARDWASERVPDAMWRLLK